MKSLAAVALALASILILAGLVVQMFAKINDLPAAHAMLLWYAAGLFAAVGFYAAVGYRIWQTIKKRRHNRK